MTNPIAEYEEARRVAWARAELSGALTLCLVWHGQRFSDRRWAPTPWVCDELAKAERAIVALDAFRESQEKKP